jgi:hypothetical protein
MLMRPFAVRGAGKAEQVQVFDKHSDRSFIARLEDVLAGRYFNTIWQDDFVQDVAHKDSYRRGMRLSF